MTTKKAKKKARIKAKPLKRHDDDALADLPFGAEPFIPAAADDDQSLHDLFQQQTMTMLDRADLSEEQKQSILVAMNCPCCGAGAMSYTVKLKR